MSVRIVLLSLCCGLSAVASAQWSEPALVWQDTTRFQEARLLNTPGDTLWTAVMDYDWTGSTEWYRIQTAWSLGDSWSEMEDITGMDSTVWGWYQGMGFGCDPRRRLWLGWYRGCGYTFQEDSWAVCTARRDSAGWHQFEKSIADFWSGGAESFAADRQGNWFMSVERLELDSPGYLADAMYSRLDCDTWTYPVMIAAGTPRPAQSEHASIVLVPHPDSGFWEVDDWDPEIGATQVCIHYVHEDTVTQLLTKRGESSEATADSAGRLWVVYLRDGRARSMVISGSTVVDSQVVAEIADGRPSVCTDPLGWVWAVWSCGWSVRVAYNAGQGWSPFEAVAGFEAEPLGIVSDSHGRVYVLFVSRDHTQLFTAYRTARPALAEQARSKTSFGQPPSTVVHSMLNLSASPRPRASALLLDATGRRVMLLLPGPNGVRHLAPGVYFVREEAEASSSKQQAVRKVIITR